MSYTNLANVSFYNVGIVGTVITRLITTELSFSIYTVVFIGMVSVRSNFEQILNQKYECVRGTRVIFWIIT